MTTIALSILRRPRRLEPMKCLLFFDDLILFRTCLISTKSKIAAIAFELSQRAARNRTYSLSTFRDEFDVWLPTEYPSVEKQKQH